MGGKRRRLVEPHEHVSARLKDGRIVFGIVMRTHEGGKRVVVAFFDPHYRRCDGYPRRIRRHRLARGHVRAKEESW